MEKTGTEGVNLQQSLGKVAAAFLFDEKLQRIMTGPLLVPHDLNTINTKFIGPLNLGEEESAQLLNSEYSDEHTKVTFEQAQVSGLKPVYGMNGA